MPGESDDQKPSDGATAEQLGSSTAVASEQQPSLQTPPPPCAPGPTVEQPIETSVEPTTVVSPSAPGPKAEQPTEPGNEPAAVTSPSASGPATKRPAKGVVEPPTAASIATASASRVEPPATAPTEPLRVTSVVVTGGGAVDNIEFKYSDGSRWSVGKPFGGKRQRWRPLLLADDEYISEVWHEALRQWWWAGAAVRFITNKGRELNARGDWGSGLEAHAHKYQASRGCCITRLKIYNGMCHGIVEGPLPPIDEDNLKLWACYWLPEGSPTSEVQHKTFAGRESAHSFANRVGAGHGPTVSLGPLRVEMEDHPWCDCIRDLCQLCFALVRSRRDRSTVARSTREFMLTGDLPNSYQELLENNSLQPAGIVVDIVRGTRVRSWGSISRRLPCEELAGEHGHFAIQRWRSRSSSFASHVERWRAMAPVLKRIASMLRWRDHMFAGILMGVSTVARSICDGAQPVLTGAIFTLINADEAEVRKESVYLHWMCSLTFGCAPRLTLAKSVILGLLMLAVFRGFTKVGMQWSQKSLREKYRSQARVQLFEHLLAQDLQQFESSNPREMSKKAQPSTIDVVMDWVLNLLATTVRLLASLCFLFAISPLMTLVYAAFLPVFESIVHQFLEQEAKSNSRREQGMESTANHVIHESCNMIRTVKTFSREDWHVSLQRYAVEGATHFRITAAQATAQIGEDILHQAMYCFSLWCGLVWMDSTFSTGELTAFLLLVTRVSQQAKDVKRQMNQLLNKKDELSQYFEFLDQTPTMSSGTYAAQVEGHVEVRDVKFEYATRPGQLVLHGVSLQLWPGKSAALVGASGSGKSTIVSLILRHYEPTGGQILVDGVALPEWDLAFLHRQMAVVAQEPLLFQTTIRQNILYGVASADFDDSPDDYEEDMIEAAKNSCAYEYIMKLPAQFDTHVGDRGSQLSGGQKQRLAVARAMIMKPRILILDEATSALDAESEGIVQEAIDRLVSSSGGSVLMIAHRLSTVKNADEIICIRDGCVIERGSPRELLDARGYYYCLVARQVITLEDIKGTNTELDRSASGKIG